MTLPALHAGDEMTAAMSKGAALCSVAIAIAGLNSAAKAETWSCEEKTASKTVTQVWTVAGDRLTTPNDQKQFRIVRNDPHILVAFHKDWEFKIAGGTPFVAYVIIDKATGGLLDLNDSVLTSLGEDYKDTVTPDANTGHCTLTEP
jgi:hypothetical protein